MTTANYATGIATWGARAPLGAYLVTQNSAKNAPDQSVSFSHQKIRKFSDEWAQPRPRPLLHGEETPRTTPLKCPHYN